MAFRLPRFRHEEVVDGKPGSDLFRRWWGLLVEQAEATDADWRAAVDDLTQIVTDNALDAETRYVRADGTISTSAATTTHKLAWTDPKSGRTYYILLSNV